MASKLWNQRGGHLKDHLVCYWHLGASARRLKIDPCLAPCRRSNPCATTNKKNFVDLAILKACFIHGLLHMSHGWVLRKRSLFGSTKPATGQSFPHQLSKSTVFLVVLLDQLDGVVHESVVEVLNSKKAAAIGGQHLKPTVGNGQYTNIKSTNT